MQTWNSLESGILSVIGKFQIVAFRIFFFGNWSMEPWIPNLFSFIPLALLQVEETSIFILLSVKDNAEFIFLFEYAFVIIGIQLVL